METDYLSYQESFNLASLFHAGCVYMQNFNSKKTAKTSSLMNLGEISVSREKKEAVVDIHG